MKKNFAKIMLVVGVLCMCVTAIAFASRPMVNWQCERCGQREWLKQDSLPAQYGCGGDFTVAHVWHRM